MYELELSAVFIYDLNNIIIEYCLGTVREISYAASDRAIFGALVTYKKHTLSMTTYREMSRAYFNYEKRCQSKYINDKFSCEWSDHVEFILTGYNEYIFDEFRELVKWSIHGINVPENTPCCKYGDAQSLSEKLLKIFRSRIIGVT